MSALNETFNSQAKKLSAPVVADLSDNTKLKPVMDYMASFRQANTIAARMEFDRLEEYFSVFHDRLLKDMAEVGIEPRKTPYADPDFIRKTFQGTADKNGSTILSEFMVVPSSFFYNEGKSGGNSIYEKSARYADKKISFGFIQVFETEKKHHEPFGDYDEKISATTVPAIGIDDKIMKVLSSYNSGPCLEALKAVASTANHDMQHHLTSDYLNNQISQKKRRPVKSESFLDERHVQKWTDDHMSFDDEAIDSYESFLILNHARVWQEMKGSEHEARLKTECSNFLHQLQQIAGAMSKDGVDNQTIHDVVDYMGMVLNFSLFRFLPLDHPILDMAIEGIKNIDPLAEEKIATAYEDSREHFRDEEKNDCHLNATIKNYAEHGVSLEHLVNQNDIDYTKAKKQQLIMLAPEIAYLNSPAQAGSDLEKIKNRMSRLNFEMMQAVALDVGIFTPGEAIVKTNSGGYTITTFINEQGQIHADNGPAYKSVDKDGVCVNYRYMHNGEKHCEDGFAEYSFNQYRKVETYSYFHHDALVARISTDDNGEIEHVRWSGDCGQDIIDKYKPLIEQKFGEKALPQKIEVKDFGLQKKDKFLI